LRFFARMCSPFLVEIRIHVGIGIQA
jgi:hypothetical protein